LAADAEVALLQPIARRIEGGPQQVIPDGQEQAEVDVAGGAVTHVVEAVQRRPGHHPAQHAGAHVHVGVLQQQLDGNGERQHRSHRHRQAQQQQRQHAAHRFGRLVQRVFHQAVEAVHAGDAVMHRMQPPQPADAMAGVVHQGDAEIGADDGQQHLQREWPLQRPQLPRNDCRQQRHRRDRQQVQAFVDQCMQGVTQAVAVVVVERGVVRPGTFGGERDRDGDRQQGQQPQRITVAGGRPRRRQRQRNPAGTTGHTGGASSASWATRKVRGLHAGAAYGVAGLNKRRNPPASVDADLGRHRVSHIHAWRGSTMAPSSRPGPAWIPST
jgi:hypothetical protein